MLCYLRKFVHYSVNLIEYNCAFRLVELYHTHAK